MMSNNNSDLNAKANVVELTKTELDSVSGGSFGSFGQAVGDSIRQQGKNVAVIAIH
jgi:hypothetical protein